VVCTPVIPALGRLRQEAHELEAGLGYKNPRKKERGGERQGERTA
jgi:hypothetical protein